MNNTFIDKIAPLVKKYAPMYGIRVYSPIIAQAVLESTSGTSNKVKVTLPDGTIEWRHNYFGLKWRDGRCAVSNDYFEEWTSEQNKDGSYTNIVSRFCKFNSLEDCVIGYFQWTNIKNYESLKGVTDPRTYLENIKAAKYATSLKYVDNLMAVINKYDLTKYDSEVSEVSTMIINVHAGHNPDGKIACGAIGLIKESTEARKVKDAVIAKLKSLGHTVYDCTVDNGTSQNDVLRKIVAKCNAHKADLDVSIHFNSGVNDKGGNGKDTGVEVLVYSASSKAQTYANDVCKAIGKDLGLKNRGVKVRSNLYVLKNTNAPAMLIECCFVDDADDVKKYNAEAMATAIAKGITGKSVGTTETKTESSVSGTNAAEGDVLYCVQTGAYRNKANAEAQLKKLKAAGFDGYITTKK